MEYADRRPDCFLTGTGADPRRTAETQDRTSVSSRSRNAWSAVASHHHGRGERFLANHVEQIMAADLFMVPTVGRLLFVLVILAHVFDHASYRAPPAGVLSRKRATSRSPFMLWKFPSWHANS